MTTSKKIFWKRLGLLAIAAFISATAFLILQERRHQGQKICIGYLKSIGQVKAEWASENRKKAGDTVAWNDLYPAFNKFMPACPSGGTYTLGAIGTNPTCTEPEHKLP